MRLLAGISLVEGGGVLLIPVAHRGGLLNVQTPGSLVLLRQPLGNIVLVTNGHACREEEAKVRLSGRLWG